MKVSLFFTFSLSSRADDDQINRSTRVHVSHIKLRTRGHDFEFMRYRLPGHFGHLQRKKNTSIHLDLHCMLELSVRVESGGHARMYVSEDEYYRPCVYMLR